MQRCDFNKFAAYFQNSFFIDHLWVAASELTYLNQNMMKFRKVHTVFDLLNVKFGQFLIRE